MYDEYRKERVQTFIKDFLTQRTSNEVKLLDVGCGDGSLIASFCINFECYGVDIDENKITEAKKRGVIGLVLDVEKEQLPFDSNSFDIVICSQVIEHVILTDHLLSEINRVIKRKGILILSFPNINQPASLLLQLLFDYPPIFAARYKSEHVRDFTLRTMRIALTINGFRIKEVEGITIYPFRNRLARTLARIFPRLADRIIVIAISVRKPLNLPGTIGDLRSLSGML